MNATFENLVLEQLKRFPAGQDRIERKIEEMTRRLSSFELPLELYSPAQVAEFDQLEAELATVLHPR